MTESSTLDFSALVALAQERAPLTSWDPYHDAVFPAYLELDGDGSVTAGIDMIAPAVWMNVANGDVFRFTIPATLKGSTLAALAQDEALVGLLRGLLGNWEREAADAVQEWLTERFDKDGELEGDFEAATCEWWVGQVLDAASAENVREMTLEDWQGDIERAWESGVYILGTAEDLAEIAATLLEDELKDEGTENNSGPTWEAPGFSGSSTGDLPTIG